VNWKGFFSRIILVAVAFPLLGALIFLCSWRMHLAFNAVVAVAAAVGAFETEFLFRSRGIPTSRLLAPLFAGTFPAVSYLEVSGILPAGSLLPWMAAVFGILLVRAVVFQPGVSLESLLAFVSSSLFILMYPAFFLTYIVRITTLPSPSLSILFFLCIVFTNDMSAYFVGSIVGGSSRLGLPVSPQKSAAGFAAGLLGSLLAVLVFYFLAPGFFPFNLPFSLLAGLAIGVFVIVGDLIESGMKRSAGVKDSGVIIPGRGGLLDSVDSMLLSAPLFYYLFTMGSR
jgi:phosphatidate cytidylyltransferase